MLDLSNCPPRREAILRQLVPHLDPSWRLTPAQAEHIARIGAHALLQNDHDTAIAAFELAHGTHRTAESSKAHGVALAKAHRIEEALIELRAAVRIDGRDIEALCMIAELSLDALDYRSALAALQRCLALDPAGTHPSGARA